MTPLDPTTVPLLISVKQTAFRKAVVPLDWADQVAPASVVRRMAPPLPTTVAVLASRSAAAASEDPVGNGFCQDQPVSARAIAVAIPARAIVHILIVRMIQHTLEALSQQVPASRKGVAYTCMRLKTSGNGSRATR